MSELDIPQLTVRLTTSESGVILTPIGEVDMATAPLLSDAMDRLIRSRATKIIIDCGDLTYIDSTGIGVLVRAWNEMRDRVTMPIVVVNVQPQVHRVLDLCGVADFLTE